MREEANLQTEREDLGVGGRALLYSRMYCV
jgi:hypothetical protein